MPNAKIHLQKRKKHRKKTKTAALATVPRQSLGEAIKRTLTRSLLDNHMDSLQNIFFLQVFAKMNKNLNKVSK